LGRDSTSCPSARCGQTPMANIRIPRMVEMLAALEARPILLKDDPGAPRAAEFVRRHFCMCAPNLLAMFLAPRELAAGVRIMAIKPEDYLKAS
jgi:hypothetical protein